MANFILIFLCLGVGLLLKRSGRFPDKAPQAFNGFVIYIALPAVILVQLPPLLDRIHLDAHLLIPGSMAWIQFGMAYLIFRAIGKKLHFKNTEIGALILCAGLGNTSFVGLPLLEALHGPDAIPIAILVDQLGSFLVLSILGVGTAMAFSGRGGRSLAESLKSVLVFPPFFFSVLAVVWYLTGTWDHLFAREVLGRLAQTMVPLCLVAVGMQLKFNFGLFKRLRWQLGLGLGFKLLFCPLFFLILYRHVLGSNEFATNITILEGAMAPMITAAVVAEECGLDKDIANLMVGVGIPLSLATVSLWSYFLT